MKTVEVFLIAFSVASAYGEVFFSEFPLADYYLRNDVLDCVNRFYKREWEEYNQKDGPWIMPPIHGGFRAYNGEYQHMAAIGWEIDNTIKYLCGGSIILPKFVLTAAHCSVSVEGSRPTTVRVGDSDLGSPNNDDSAQQLAIRNIRRHPLHRHSRSYHDLALIELEQPIVYNVFVGPACLWLEDHVPNEPMRIVGFGETEFGLGSNAVLQQGSVSMISRDSCSEVFLGNRKVGEGFLDGQFCASHDSMDTCQGDSGGPIEVRRFNMFNRECSLIVGVTSFGTPCTNGSTGVYTKVSNYVEWIESETNETFAYEKCLSRSSFGGNSISSSSNVKSTPYVHLLRNHTIESLFNCAGVLIDDQFVLTSGRCAADTPKNIFVSQTKEIIAIDEVIIHPMFESGTPTNDIALLKLEKYLNQQLKPACIYKPVQSSRTFSIQMFNRQSSNNNFDIKYVTSQKHESTIGSSDSLQKNEICFSNFFPVVPTICQLAHGSPILDEEVESIPFLYGVVNSKSTKCEEKIYGTMVKPHLQWIKSVLVKHQMRQVLVFT